MMSLRIGGSVLRPAQIVRSMRHLSASQSVAATVSDASSSTADTNIGKELMPNRTQTAVNTVMKDSPTSHSPQRLSLLQTDDRTAKVSSLNAIRQRPTKSVLPPPSVLTTNPTASSNQHEQVSNVVDLTTLRKPLNDKPRRDMNNHGSNRTSTTAPGAPMSKVSNSESRTLKPVDLTKRNPEHAAKERREKRPKPSGPPPETPKISASLPILDLTKPLTAISRPATPKSVRATSNNKTNESLLRKEESGITNNRKQQIVEPTAPAQQIVVSIPADQTEITVKALVDMTNLSLDKVLLTLAELGGKETQSLIPPRVLEMVRGGRTVSRGAVNATAAGITLPIDTAELLLLEMGCQIKYLADLSNDRLRSQSEANTPMRPPIVVVMGHVDHGKTTLLDALRSTSVAKGEQGGITQSIAGFRVDLPNSGLSACFLDTPGHEAFASMRKSGTAVTDVACVVVATTDGVMPQTIESIQYARKAKLPIVFALTKVDMAKARASVNEVTTQELEARVIDQLNSYGLYDASSDVFVPVVAPKGEGLDALMDAIMLQVEVNEDQLLARCEPNAPGEAVVLESKVDRAFGAVADVVVRWGTLKVGDFVVCNEKWGKIRRMLNSEGASIQTCPASNPVRICGFEDCLSPGSDVLVVADEKECKRIVEYREKRLWRNAQRDAKRRSLQKARGETNGDENDDDDDGEDDREVIVDQDGKVIRARPTRREKRVKRKLQQEKLEQNQQRQDERRSKEYRVILKADAEGSLMALQYAVKQLQKGDTIPEGRELTVVKSSVGQFSEQDLELAQTTDAYLLGFNVKLPNSLSKKAKTMSLPGVSIHPVIYNLMDEFAEKYLKGKAANGEGEGKDDEQEARVKGVAQVLSIFELKGKDKKQVAGIRVVEGALNKNDSYVVKRNGEVIAEFKLVDSLRILKKDVPSVEKGSECGLALKDFAAFEVGDSIEAKDPPQHQAK